MRANAESLASLAKEQGRKARKTVYYLKPVNQHIARRGLVESMDEGFDEGMTGSNRHGLLCLAGFHVFQEYCGSQEL